MLSIIWLPLKQPVRMFCLVCLCVCVVGLRLKGYASLRLKNQFVIFVHSSPTIEWTCSCWVYKQVEPSFFEEVLLLALLYSLTACLPADLVAQTVDEGCPPMGRQLQKPDSLSYISFIFKSSPSFTIIIFHIPWLPWKQPVRMFCLVCLCVCG